MKELLIIGGGPAGIAAGVYAARKKINAAIVTDVFGGQSVVSADVRNFIGFTSISGLELAENMERQLRAQDEIEIIDGNRAISVEEKEIAFFAKTENGKIIEAKTLLITTGSKRRKLGVPGEEKYDGKGVAYCSTCDAPLFKDKRAAVVGGGNSGLESAVDLLPYASEIFIFESSDKIKGDAITLERLSKENKVSFLTRSEILEIRGNRFVSGIKYKDLKTGEEKEKELEGVFVEIGWIPNSDIVKNIVETNKYGEIIVDHKTQRSSHSRVWAAGDVADVLYKQNNISMGDAVKAVLNINEYLNSRKR